MSESYNETLRNFHTLKDYEQQYAGRTWKQYRDLLAQVIREAEPGVLLDIGSGMGFFTECAHRFGIRSVGLDGSLEGLKKVRERVGDLRMISADNGESLPFRDQSVSIAVAAYVVEHMSHDSMMGLFSEVHRILIPNGTFWCFSPSPKADDAYDDPHHINVMAPSTLRNCLRNAGFHSVESKDSPRNFLGKSYVCRRIANFIFRRFPYDRLSVSSHALARKEDS